MELGYLAGGIAIGLASFGTAIGIGMLAAKAMEGISRQPSASSEIRTSMIIAIAFVEALCLYALVIALILVTK